MSSSLRPPKLAGKPPKLRPSSAAAAPPPPTKIPTPSSSSSAPSLPPPQTAHGHGHKGNGNVDKVLFNKLVDMVPLVESLMDRRGNQSFRRRAAVVVTPTPSNSTKAIDQKGRRMAQTSSAKKKSGCDDGDSNELKTDKDDDLDVSLSAPKAVAVEDDQNDAEEVNMLRLQLDEFHKKLMEKDEALASLKESTNNINMIYLTLNELKQQVAEKDSSIATINSQLDNTEIKLAEKQTALGKLETEVADSNGMVEEFQGNLGNLEFEIVAFKKFFEELSDVSSRSQDEVASFHPVNQLSYIDDINETWILKMEEAREAYMAALTDAKDNPSDECLSAVVEARLNLCSFLTS